MVLLLLSYVTLGNSLLLEMVRLWSSFSRLEFLKLEHASVSKLVETQIVWG